MLSLSKLSYFALNESDKHSYDNSTLNILKIDLQSCYVKQIEITKGCKHKCTWGSQICATSASYGHLDCLQLVTLLSGC